MRAVHPLPFLKYSAEELSKLGTRHLEAIRHGTFICRNYCSCGARWHCGDDVLSAEERTENEQLSYLRTRVNKVLKNREDPTTPRKYRAPEKKQMRYTR